MLGGTNADNFFQREFCARKCVENRREGLTPLPPSHLFSERTPASTAIPHPYPPPSSTRHHLHLSPVSSSPSHLHQPQPLTRINPALSPVSSSLSHLYLPPSPTRITPSLAPVSTSVWHSSYPSTRCLPEPRRNDCQKREDMTGEWSRMRKGVGTLYRTHVKE